MKPEPMTLDVQPHWFGARRPKPKRVEVTFREKPHWAREHGLSHGRSGRIANPRAYDVLVKGRKVGEIERSILSTDQHYNRIRVPGRGRPGWAARRNEPGARTSYDTTFEWALRHVLGGSLTRVK